MTLTLEGLKAQFQHPNVQAFARCVPAVAGVRRSEGATDCALAVKSLAQRSGQSAFNRPFVFVNAITYRFC
jgi:hypothetical protein